MPQARKNQISLVDTPFYHCVSRSVRRSFLCGTDGYSGQSFEHRRGWVFVPTVKNGTDVCDLYNKEGLSELKRQIYESHDQYFNGQYSQNVAGLFNYIYL